jgi:hypothetical protein
MEMILIMDTVWLHFTHQRLNLEERSVGMKFQQIGMKTETEQCNTKR